MMLGERRAEFDRLGDEFDKLAKMLEYDVRAARFPRDEAEQEAVEMQEAA